jgi:transketolase
MAHVGQIPFAGSYAAFSPGRNWEQIRTTIALNNVPVKVVGSHAGLTVGPDGATHQMLEDIALMRIMPGMVVIAPGDAVEAEKVALAVATDPRPTYIRLAREKSPIFSAADAPFEIGKAYILREGSDVTICATGTMAAQTLLAAAELEKKNISAEVVHVPTIKPLDADTILTSARKTGRVVAIEEHQIAGGLGGAIAELLSENLPLLLKRIGLNDEFGQSGTAAELLDFYGLTAKRIVEQIVKLNQEKD